MDIKTLEYFVTVINEKNISNAAKKLHMTQPPLSTQLKLLEEEVGCTLFQRGSRQIQLTEAGKILYKRANTILELVQITRQELLDFSLGEFGTLRIGVASSVGNILLEKWLKPFQEFHPKIRYEIFEANTYQLLEKLETGIIELAIVRTPFTSNKFKVVDIHKEPMIAIGDPKYVNDPNSNTVTLSELTNTPVILYRRWEKIIIDTLKEDNLELDIFCKNDDARTTVQMANLGFGMAIVPASARSLADTNKTIAKEILDERLNSSIKLIYSEASYTSSIAHIFIEFLSRSIF